MSTRAIILAAGRGSRLHPMTLGMPKCLIEIRGQSLIARQIDALHSIGVDDVVVVVGHMKEQVMRALGPAVRYREYEGFLRTNNLHTLWSARDELDSDCFCLFADVLFDRQMLAETETHGQPFCMLVDTSGVREGTMRVTVSGDRITGIGSHIPPGEADGNFIGIARFSRAGARALVEEMSRWVSGHFDQYYTVAIDAMARRGAKVGFLDVAPRTWRELDTVSDLEEARELFARI